MAEDSIKDDNKVRSMESAFCQADKILEEVKQSFEDETTFAKITEKTTELANIIWANSQLYGIKMTNRHINILFEMFFQTFAEEFIYDRIKHISKK